MPVRHTCPTSHAATIKRMSLDLCIPKGDPSSAPRNTREIFETLSRLGYSGGASEYVTSLPLRPRDECKRASALPPASSSGTAAKFDLVGATSVVLARSGSSVMSKYDSRRLSSKALSGSKRVRDMDDVEAPADSSTLASAKSPFREFYRITLQMDAQDSTAAGGSSGFTTSSASFASQCKEGAGILASYDIVAAQPVDSGGLAACISAGKGGAIDIIVLDMSSGRLPFPLSPQDVNSAISSGMLFELRYSPAIRDASMRRAFFTHAATLLRVTRGRGLILSSGARSPLELRAPRAVAAIASLAGFSLQQATVALTAAPATAIAHAEKRKKQI